MEAVVGLFGTDQDSEQALSELDKHGFGKNNIDVVAVEKDTGEGNTANTGRRSADDTEGRRGERDVENRPAPPVGFIPAATPQGVAGTPNSNSSGLYAAGYVPVPYPVGKLRARLADMGVKEEDRDFFAGAARRGGTLIVVKAEKERAGQVARIMRDCNGVTQDRY